MEAQIRVLPIEDILPSKTNPRQVVTAASDEDLLESIKQKGVLEKILVRPLENGNYQIVDGSRRLRKAKEAGFTGIQAEIREMSDEEVVEYQLISFLQRVGLHPLDEAQAYAKLQREQKLDARGISAKVGKTSRYVAERLQLTKLIPAVNTALFAEKVSLDHALLIAKLQADAQARALKACTDSWQPLTVKRLREWINEEIHLDLETAPFPREDEKLLPQAGPCSVCPKRAGNNPDLFGDVKKSVCTDRTCFYAKVKAWTEQEVERLKSEGKQIKKISGSYYSTPKGILAKDAYTVVDSAKASSFGVYVDGENKGMLVGIRMKGEKPTTAEGGTKKAAPSFEHRMDLYHRRMEIFEARIEQQARNEVFKALLRRLRWPISRKEFDVIVPELFERRGDRFHQYEIDMVAAATGIKMPKEGYNFDSKVKALIPKLTDQQVVQFAFATVLQQELIYDPTTGDPGDDRFKTLLAIHKQVDRRKLTVVAAKQLESKKPRRPEKELKQSKKSKKK